MGRLLIDFGYGTQWISYVFVCVVCFTGWSDFIRKPSETTGTPWKPHQLTSEPPSETPLGNHLELLPSNKNSMIRWFVRSIGRSFWSCCRQAVTVCEFAFILIMFCVLSFPLHARSIERSCV